MGQDLRELLQNNFSDISKVSLSEGHELRFMDKLAASFPEQEIASVANATYDYSAKSKSVFFLSTLNWKQYSLIAASLASVLFMGAGYVVWNNTAVQQAGKTVVYIDETADFVPSLANVSPELKKVEEEYLNTINVGLSKLRIDDSNRSMVKGGITQLTELKKEYYDILKSLNKQTAAPQTIKVLLDNLEMQLFLINQLRKKVKSTNEFSYSTAYQDLQT